MFVSAFLKFQKKFHIPVLLVGIVLSILFYHRAMTLLKTVKTDLINLLPKDYDVVQLYDVVEAKFKKRNNLYLLVHSPDKEANFKAMLAVRDYLGELPEVGKIITEKPGYDFFEKNKLLLLDTHDIYEVRDRLKEKIEKEKLKGLYVDLEEQGKKVTFDDLIDKYKRQFAEGVNNRYQANADGTVYAINIFPKSEDAGLSFYKKFGGEVKNHLAKFDFKKFNPEMTYGFAGAIVTRVDQYDTIMKDLGRAGIVSSWLICILLYFYFFRFLEKGKGIVSKLKVAFWGLIPVATIMIPMTFSLIFCFAFCSLFFDHLNIITSFLFAIILGLGMDVGIHFMTRSLQDRAAGMSLDDIHYNMMVKTGKGCIVGILTNVAGFFALLTADFQGFSEFGWIAGIGLLIGLLCNLIFFPSFVFLTNRFNLLSLKKNILDESTPKTRNYNLSSKAFKLSFSIIIVITVLALAVLPKLSFEWNFGKLNIKLPEREAQKELLRQTHGRVNRPAVYLVDNVADAKEIKKVIHDRKKHDKKSPTVEFIYSYYDMFPDDQDEKIKVYAEIREQLKDDLVVRALTPEQKETVNELIQDIDQIKKITKEDVPEDVKEIFLGEEGDEKTSAVYVMPLPDLQLDDGNNAISFYDDIYDVKTNDKQYHAVSDAMVFAEVLQTLFKESRLSISLAALIILLIIIIHFRNMKETGIIFSSLVCGIFWMLGVMAVFGLKLNFYNMIVIPAMLGIGVDNSVHLVHRFDEMGRKSVFETLQATGGAIFMASLANALGYSGLIFTKHPGLYSMGVMALIGMGTCLIGSLVVMPLLLQLFMRKKAEPH